ncbi:MAG: hypothetical protein ABJN26_16675 [Stappiaceae bacterium]
MKYNLSIPPELRKILPKLTGKKLLLFLAIKTAQKQSQQDWCQLSFGELSNECIATKRHTIRILNELVEDGTIEKRGGPKQFSPNYWRISPYIISIDSTPMSRSQPSCTDFLNEKDFTHA